MSMVLGRRLGEFRDEYGEEWEHATRTTLAIHEAAHAIVAYALGYAVTRIRVWNDAGEWRGECLCTIDAAPMSDQQVVTAAGAAGQAWVNLFPGLDASPEKQRSRQWLHCGDDIADMERLEPGIDGSRRELYRRQADRILQRHHRLFDALCDALLRHDGDMDGIAIRSVFGITSSKPVTATLSYDDALQLVGAMREKVSAHKAHTYTPMAVKTARRTPLQVPFETRDPVRARQSSSQAQVIRVPAHLTNGVRWARSDGTIVTLKPGDPYPA